jgi:hypothetical protein
LQSTQSVMRIVWLHGETMMVRMARRIPCKVWRVSMLPVLSKLEALCRLCSIHSEAFGLCDQDWSLCSRKNNENGRLQRLYTRNFIEMCQVTAMHCIYIPVLILDFPSGANSYLVTPRANIFLMQIELSSVYISSFAVSSYEQLHSYYAKNNIAPVWPGSTRPEAFCPNTMYAKPRFVPQ